MTTKRKYTRKYTRKTKKKYRGGLTFKESNWIPDTASDTANIDLLRSLNITYDGPEEVDMVSFYMNPRTQVNGFSSSWRNALNDLPSTEIETVQSQFIEARKATLETPLVMMIVGRMNPPTPGHLDLCMYLLQQVKQYALGSDTESLNESATRANILPRIFLTNTTNEAKFSKLSKSLQSKYANVVRLVDGKPDEEYTFNVKDKNLENPLMPEDKKQVLIQMLMSKSKEYPYWNWTEEQLKEWIVTGEDCSQSLFTATQCAISKTGGDGRKVILYMGKDAEQDMDRRRSFCISNEVSSSVIPVQCKEIERTGSGPTGSMSGSKIRLLISSEQYDQVREIYQGLLEEHDIRALIQNVRRGLRMTPPVFQDPRAAEETTLGGKYTKRRTQKYRKRRLTKLSRKIETVV
jgi:hypothetical protein